METLIILSTWSHSGCTGYEEFIGPWQDCEKIAKSAMSADVYQARATSYAFGRGEVVQAYGCGRFNTGWRS